MDVPVPPGVPVADATAGAAQDPGGLVLGREAETRRLLEAADPTARTSRVLILTGAAGTGKSTLLDAAVDRAAGRGTVLTARGTETESGLAHAGLHQLLYPVADFIDALPAGQRGALRTALGADTAHDAPAPLLLGVALLTLLSDLGEAGRGRLLLVVDDAQWIDAASRNALFFAARRLQNEPVTVLLAVRGEHPLPGLDPHWPVLPLGPLDRAASARLLDACAHRIPGRLRERILDQAEGNPLALVELARAAADTDIPATAPGPLPVTERLEHLFAHRLKALPVRAQQALTLLAAADTDDPRAAVPALLPAHGDPLWEQAERAGLIRGSGAGVAFSHPLVRSAVYQAAPFEARRTAHLALAEALRGEPDRSAWHRAAATPGPDAQVSAALEVTADRAGRRGGYDAASRALERAAELSPERERAARLLVRAAGMATGTGRLARVRDLADRASTLTEDRTVRAQAAFQAGRLTALTSSHTAAFTSLTTTAESAAASAPALATEALAYAAVVRFYSGEDHHRHEIHRILPGLPTTPEAETARIWLRVIADPHTERAELLREVRTLIARPRGGPRPQPGTEPQDRPDTGAQSRPLTGSGPGVRQPERLAALAIGAWLLDETALAVRTFDEAAERWRARGPVPDGLGGVTALAYFDYGRWDRAQLECGEVAAVAQAAGLDHASACAPAVEGMIAAHRGNLESARALVDRSLSLIDPAESRSIAVYARRALGGAAAAEGDYERACTQLRAAFGPEGDPVHYHASWAALPELAEAAARSGRQAEASAVVERMAALPAAACGSPRLGALVQFSRALLAAPDAAEPFFRDAVRAGITDGQRPFERARFLLSHAEWLRRQRHIAQARPLLSEALEVFQRLGARPWTERARAELRAAGAETTEAAPDALTRLTPQQQQIVRLAARGLTNREIGEKLFLSPRTVGSHLYRSFPKLGITARSQLRDVVAASA